MKKLVVIVMALVAVSFTANAQFGSVVGGALKKTASKTIDKTIDKTVDKTTAKAGEGALASYWVEVVPLQFAALKNAQELIKTMQLPVAAQLNDAAAAYDKEQGKTMYSSRNYIMDCALNYLRLGLRLTDVYQPTF